MADHLLRDPVPGSDRGTRPPVEQVSSRIAYENPWMSVREDEVAWSDGTTGIYGVVVKPDFAVVLARQDGGFWLVEQYRYPTRSRGWEFPMGSWPPGHPGGAPEELARHELAEETGVTADTWRHLGRLNAANGHSSARCDVFLATGLHHGTPHREPTEADMRHRLVPDGELADMIRSGRFVDAQSLAALSLYREVVVPDR